jgi:hypothetical protein
VSRGKKGHEKGRQDGQQQGKRMHGKKGVGCVGAVIEEAVCAKLGGEEERSLCNK